MYQRAAAVVSSSAMVFARKAKKANLRHQAIVSRTPLPLRLY